MKLQRILPALGASLLLAACQTAQPLASTLPGSMLPPASTTPGTAPATTTSTNIPPGTINFQFSVANGANIIQSSNVAYYVVLNDSADATQGPMVNGSVPQSRPYPNPLSYLPFARDARADYTLDITDNAPLSPTHWKVYYALYQEAGQEVLWQGKLNTDGTVNERALQLQSGQWSLSGNTVQITLPLNTFLGRAIDDTTAFPPQLEMNYAVALRTQFQYWTQGVIKRYGLTPNTFFTVPTTPGDQTITESQSGVQYPGNLPAGSDVNAANIVSYHYHIGGGQ